MLQSICVEIYTIVINLSKDKIIQFVLKYVVEIPKEGETTEILVK